MDDPSVLDALRKVKRNVRSAWTSKSMDQELPASMVAVVVAIVHVFKALLLRTFHYSYDRLSYAFPIPFLTKKEEHLSKPQRERKPLPRKTSPQRKR